MLNLAKEKDLELHEKLIENALEDCISSFNGFGRNLCNLHSKKAKNPNRASKISFQNRFS